MLGDYKDIEDGILELRIHLGQGFRLYVRQIGKTMMLIISWGREESTKNRTFEKLLILVRI